MSFDKAIFYGKTKRKRYRKSKLLDYSCRNHGSCLHCRRNRTFNNESRKHFAILEYRSWLRGEYD